MKVALLLLVSLTVTACSTSHALYNVNEALIPNANRSSVEQTGDQIVKALQYKRWRVQAREPGLITAQIDVRKHSATIEIRYDERRFSITHQRSTLLEYDPSRKTIHRNYNKWIKLLEDEIYYYMRNPSAEAHQAH